MDQEFQVGQRVVAVMDITEGGKGYVGSEEALFPSPNYIHAKKGCKGIVEDVRDGLPTVRFSPKGTATIVGKEEVRLVPQSSPA